MLRSYIERLFLVNSTKVKIHIFKTTLLFKRNIYKILSISITKCQLFTCTFWKEENNWVLPICLWISNNNSCCLKLVLPQVTIWKKTKKRCTIQMNGYILRLYSNLWWKLITFKNSSYTDFTYTHEYLWRFLKKQFNI